MDLKVAVLDSGIDHTHESLSKLVDRSLGKNFTSEGNDNDTMDYHGHGTHVSGTIASYNRIDGVMKRATLIPVKVMNQDGNGTYYQAQQGIYHSISVGADVINMSMGGEHYSEAYEDAVDFAMESNVMIVAASGIGEAKFSIIRPVSLRLWQWERLTLEATGHTSRTMEERWMLWRRE